MVQYVEYEEFLPYILNEAPGASRPMVETLVRKFVIRLCEKGLIIRKHSSEINIAENVVEYEMNFMEKLYRPVGIVEAHYIESDTAMDPINEALLNDQRPNWRLGTTSTRPNRYWLTIDSKLHVYPKPTQDIDEDPIVAECYVVPKRDSTKIDEFVYDNYVETVAHGVLSELQLWPDQSWTDADMAQLNGRKWRQGLRNARADSLRGKDGTQPTEIYPKSYVVFGQ